MSDGPREIGRVPCVLSFKDGSDPVSFPLIVGIEGGAVTIRDDLGAFWLLDREDREHFQKLFMQAEREAEAWEREHADVVEAEIWCGDSSECVNGPADHIWRYSCPGWTEVPSGG